MATKSLRRVLEATSADADEVSRMTFPALIRTGWEEGVVPGGWIAWDAFRKLRNATSHTYDENLAIDAAEKIPAFLDEAKTLTANLAARLDK